MMPSSRASVFSWSGIVTAFSFALFAHFSHRSLDSARDLWLKWASLPQANVSFQMYPGLATYMCNKLSNLLYHAVLSPCVRVPYVCMFQEKYRTIAPCSNWSVKFPDMDAHTYHTNTLAMPPMGHVVFCAHGFLCMWSSPPHGPE